MKTEQSWYRTRLNRLPPEGKNHVDLFPCSILPSLKRTSANASPYSPTCHLPALYLPPPVHDFVPISNCQSPTWSLFVLCNNTLLSLPRIPPPCTLCASWTRRYLFFHNNFFYLFMYFVIFVRHFFEWDLHYTEPKLCISTKLSNKKV
jgi:hypothetical protein